MLISIYTAMLILSGEENVKNTFRRVLPVLVALVPAIIIGSVALIQTAPTWVRLIVYVTILPLVLLQAAGIRRPVKSERSAGVPLGVGVGPLYSITAISSPPIALFFNNQGLVKNEFKAAIAQIRSVESYTTILVCFSLGLFTVTTLQIFTFVALPVLFGVPLRFLIVRKIRVEVFRRVCMSFDAWIESHGPAVVLGVLFGLITVGYAIMALAVGIDALLLYRFFGNMRRQGIPGTESK